MNVGVEACRCMCIGCDVSVGMWRLGCSAECMRGLAEVCVVCGAEVRIWVCTGGSDRGVEREAVRGAICRCGKDWGREVICSSKGVTDATVMGGMAAAAKYVCVLDGAA